MLNKTNQMKSQSQALYEECMGKLAAIEDKTSLATLISKYESRYSFPDNTQLVTASNPK